MWRHEVEVDVVASRQQGCLTYADLLGAGVSESAVRHALKTGHLQSLHRSVYRLIDGNHYPYTKHMSAALACGKENALVRGCSALWVFGALEDDPDDVDITVPGARRSNRKGIQIHGDRPHPRDVGHYQGVPITS